MFGHDPPTYLRSIAATRCPCLAKVQAAIVDPVPPPRSTRSYSSGSIFLDNWAEEAFSILFYVSSNLYRVLGFLKKFEYLLSNQSATTLTRLTCQAGFMSSTPFLGESGRCWSKLRPMTILPPRVIRRLSTRTVPVEQRARETHRGLTPTPASKTRRKVWSET